MTANCFRESRQAAGSNPKTARRVAGYMAMADRGEVRLRGRPRRSKRHSATETMAISSVRRRRFGPRAVCLLRAAPAFSRVRQHHQRKLGSCRPLCEDLVRLKPGPEGIRLFYSPMDNGIALTRMLRAVHARFPNTPVLVVLRGRGLEDLRNTMGRLVDRICEHPLSVFVLQISMSGRPWCWKSSRMTSRTLSTNDGGPHRNQELRLSTADRFTLWGLEPGMADPPGSARPTPSMPHPAS